MQAMLADISDRLRQAAVPEADLCAQHVLAQLLGCPRLELPFQAVEHVSPGWKSRLEDAVSRLEGGEPLQYVIGHVDFMGFEIRTDPRALIPRPETEELVDRALAEARRLQQGQVADIGTGTGCIAVALAGLHPGLTVWAADTSRPALSLAAENIRRHGLESRIQLVPSNRFECIPEHRFDLVVSNPPYVRDAEMEILSNQIRAHEPRSALAAGPDGLDVIRPLIAEAYRRLTPGGRLWLEIGSAQAAAVVGLARAAGYRDVRVYRDLAGLDRILAAVRPSSDSS